MRKNSIKNYSVTFILSNIAESIKFYNLDFSPQKGYNEFKRDYTTLLNAYSFWCNRVVPAI